MPNAETLRDKGAAARGALCRRCNARGMVDEGSRKVQNWQLDGTR